MLRKKEIIACFKYDEKGEEEDVLKVIYKNGNYDYNKIKVKVKVRIINKMKDMNEIIKNKEFELSKWNTNNITNMSYMFYNCESLLS